ncbi:MAG: hypothetical protein SNH55_01835 [Rikenellaceae bacterium]
MNSSNILKALLVVMLLVTIGLVGGAVATGGSAEMISYNIMWGYFLAAFAIAASLLCAVMGMVSAPAGLKVTGLSVILVAIVVGASWSVASGHSIQIVNLGDGGFFGAEETIISEASIYVTYAAFVGAVVVSLLSEVMGMIGGGVASPKQN